jgi:hypothetical protein
MAWVVKPPMLKWSLTISAIFNTIPVLPVPG